MRKLIAQHEEVYIGTEEHSALRPGHVRVRTTYSAISPGSEMGLIGVSNGQKLDLGYSAAGLVTAVGEGVSSLREGDRVACYGAPYVKHGECLQVPVTLCSKVPQGVLMKEAAFGGIGAIAIHALRTARLQFGERVVVAGLGLLGQMIAMIAEAAAYDVICYDVNVKRVKEAEKGGLKAFRSSKKLEGIEADAVLLCAGGKQSTLTQDSPDWIRNRGKIVIVGDIEPEYPRAKIFKKEAELLISRAGGPGRYDVTYEQDAIDYPIEYVRWTEGRNVGEFLRLLATGKIEISCFTRKVTNMEEAYLTYGALGNQEISAAVIEYGRSDG
ncbi:zinc-dependent alcohol dehydrogenase [Salimicrobium halophilum]|uniref:Alcohol dehydrogenase-like N-terminal domain-containing protein n=1 Tax=Salimicrobium halophilum TaxID=86666 RepID=A0A1G8SAB1_9BACI|nr:zinc-binding alcohol dehydrogenase [Salimicrobium halophilum]SDJ25715.1 hypothetical protein SAMN04490247_1322 [Salimicrobium halophilum]